MDLDYLEVRRKLIFGIPCVVLFLVLCYFLTRYLLIAPVFDIISGKSAVRIYPAVILAPFAGLMAIVMLVVLPMKAMPIFPNFTKMMEKPFNWIVGLNALILLAVLLFSTIIQNNFMPQFGYSKCGLLRGQPSLWFTDWIRNPELCVKGKSLEWVAEQASRVQ